MTAVVVDLRVSVPVPLEFLVLLADCTEPHKGV